MLKLGTAKVEITPRDPLPLAGFSERTGVFERVRHAIHARLLCFEFQDAAGRSRRSLLVSADLIWWGSERITALKQRIAERCVMDQAAILLHATHSHSGPQTSTRFAPSLGVASPQYLAAMESAIVDAAAAAAADLEPVTVERGSGSCSIGIHRRKNVNGNIQMAPNSAGPNDPECIVVRFRSRSGNPKALLVHFTCHPTTTAANEISCEFPGLAMQELEDAANPRAVAVFMQGCCGDVRPNLVRDGAFYRGGDDDVCSLAHQIAAAARGVLAAPMTPCIPAAWRLETARLDLEFGEIVSLSELDALAAHRGIEDESARWLKADPRRLLEIPWLEMTGIVLAENLSLLAFNAEMVVEYGLLIKRQFGGRVLPLGYTNGMLGYVTTEQQLADGGYEPVDSTRYFGLPGPFAANTEKNIRAAAIRIGESLCGS